MSRRLSVVVSFVFVECVLVFVVLMLLRLDWIVNDVLYGYGLVFSVEWAVPYWTVLRVCLGLIGLSVVAVAVVGYGLYKGVRREGGGVVFLCRSCGKAWTLVDRSVRVKGELPKFKVVKSCPSCNERLLDEETGVVQTDSVEAHVEKPMFAEASEKNRLE